MESELSEAEKTKDVALGEVQEKNSPVYMVSGGKKPTKIIKNAYPGSYESSIIEWCQFVMFLNLYNNYIVLDD